MLSDDQIPFQAHKVVLSACSPVIKDLLTKNPHSHPIVYLRGVNQYHLQSLPKFMYLGEAIITQNYIEEFLKIADEFQIKGLAKDNFFYDENDPVKVKMMLSAEFDNVAGVAWFAQNFD